MGLNRPFDRTFHVINGSVKTTGASRNLAKGQLAFVDTSKTSPDGVKIVSSFAGKNPKAKDFSIRCGIGPKTADRSHANHDESSMPFALNSITGIRVSVPKQTEQTLDALVLGWDGITPGSEFKFQTGDAPFQIAVEFSGDYISYLGGGIDKEIVIVKMEVPSCDPFDNCTDCDNCATVDCKQITLDAIEQLRRRQISSGHTVDEIATITPVFSCDTDVTATLIPYDYYTLELCDTGTDSALAEVVAQYDSPVIRIDRRGATSVYQVLLPTSEGAPDDFSPTIGSVIKDCTACPAGYTATVGGLLYAFTIEDDGSDQSALITALSGYVATTVVKSGNSAGVGFYTAVFSAELSDAAIAAFVGGAAPRNTATVTLVDTISALCDPDSQPADVAWVVGDTCNAVSETYEIILSDTECGESRLTEIQGAFPNNTIITKQELSGVSQRIVTLTGSSGTANITVTGTGVAYLATYATSLTVTATNFVATHAATLLAVQGITVTSSGATLIFKHATTAFPTITAPVNATGNLAGSIGALTALTQDINEGCSRIYSTTVVTNLVCEECDPIFEDFYKSTAPENFDLAKWVKVEDTTTQPNGNCKCGIKIVGKPFILAAEEALRDQIGFVESATLVRASAGYPEEIREGIGQLPEGAYVGRYLSRFTPRTHLGGNLTDMENKSRTYFRGLDNRKDYLGRTLLGETSNIEDLLVQYVHYTVEVSHFNHSGSFAGRINNDINYGIYVEVGKHQAIEAILNNLAANAGVSGVQAFGA